MKNTERNVLIELGIYQNNIDIDSMNYGWEYTRGALRSRSRWVGNAEDWGLVHSQRDFRHVKFCLKRGDIGRPYFPTFGLIIGKTKLNTIIQEDEYDFYMVLIEGPPPRVLKDGHLVMGTPSGGVGDPRSKGGVFGSPWEPLDLTHNISIAKVYVNFTRLEYEIQERFVEKDIDYIDWGLIYTREGSKIKAFATDPGEPSGASSRDPPTECILEYDFIEEPWEERLLGVFGYDVSVHTALGYVRMEYGLDANYKDYSATWTEDGMMKANIKLNRNQYLIDQLKGGAPAFMYVKPFRKEVTPNDLYGDRSMLFGGYMTQFKDNPDYLSIDMSSNLGFLDRYEDNTILETLEFLPGGPVFTPKDCFEVLESIFKHACRLRDYNHVSRSSEWHTENDRPFNVSGSLLNATISFAHFLEVLMNTVPCEEGVFTDVDIQEPGSGVILELDVEDEVGEENKNLIHELKLDRLIGPNKYINKLRGIVYIQDIGGEWSPMRARRLKRLLGDELMVVEDQIVRFGQFIGTKDDITNNLEEYLGLQSYEWGGEITLNGSHHYLGGMHNQGMVKINHTRRGMINSTFRVAGYTITPFKTTLQLTKRPRKLLRPPETEFQQRYMYTSEKNIFSNLGQTKIEVWKDTVSVMSTDNITDAKLKDDLGNDITDWVSVHETVFEGYKFIDCKFTENDLIAISGPYRARYIALRNSAFGTMTLELNDYYSFGSWVLPPDPYGTGSRVYNSELYATVGLLEDNYKFEILDGYFVLGEISGGLGDPNSGGGEFGDPRGEEYLEI